MANCTNGIGRQTQTLLGALGHRWNDLTARTGPFTPYLAIPTPGPRTWAYDPARLAATEQIISARGGQILPLDHDDTAEFWSPTVWRQLSRGAAATALQLTRHYDQIAVIAVDTPFLGTGTAYLANPTDQAKITILLTPYGTAHIHGHPDPDPARLDWEHHGLNATTAPGIHVADIGRFLTTHLINRFGLSPDHFLPYKSSLDLHAPDLTPMPPDQARRTATAFGVPTDRTLLLTIGRTATTKGIDLLLNAVAQCRDAAHLVAIIVAFDDHDPLLDDYRRRIAALNLDATLITTFTRQLPRALASLPTTRAVICPSRGETLANVPFEVALWARHGGPVVVAPAKDGFLEQITHGHTGLLYPPNDPAALVSALRHAIGLGQRARTRMCAAAYQRVATERDVIPNLSTTLRYLLPAPAHSSR
ncbi:glycosyltransferase family 4 protein [Actinomadura sp. SCN-SB]|uniref:glycosyltransferase family 4 protein n=1 Tax=Actinomadura sp. SCN-SB TaxID=3373092 RepID=UPI003752428C